MDIKVIHARDSAHADILGELGQLDVPIGRLDDVEVVFLHYKDPLLARDKWNRRIERVNWNNLILKFSYMSKCTDKHIAEFQKVKGVKKFCFVPREFEDMEDLYIYPSRLHSMTDLGDDVFDWNKYIDVVNLINRPITGVDQYRIDEGE